MLRLILSALLLFFLSIQNMSAQQLRVSDNGRFLVYGDGSPFFWQADTAWELTHRCSREEIDWYLTKRKEQGFNVIQTVALAELDGLNSPNREGQKPLLDNDPTQPNPAYFEIIDYALERAAAMDMFIALLPTWGDKVFTESWGVGPEIFNPDNAYSYGKWIGERYSNTPNIIWIIGGDRNPRAGSTDVAIWNRMAEGILAGVSRPDDALMSFHPQPKEGGGSSEWFHQEDWLDFNMHQTGHCAEPPSYEKIRHDYALEPVKPVVDGEPLYEDHPNCFNAVELGYSLPRDIRRIMYWNVFSGAFGQTYGCHAVWQMHSPDRDGINGPLRPWKEALDLPVAGQMIHLKKLMLSRPFLRRIPDSTLIKIAQAKDASYAVATRDMESTYAMVYFPMGGHKVLDLSVFKSAELRSFWYCPRTGITLPGPVVQSKEQEFFQAPSAGPGQDWVLVLDREDLNYPTPGTTMAD